MASHAWQRSESSRSPREGRGTKGWSCAEWSSKESNTGEQEGSWQQQQWREEPASSSSAWEDTELGPPWYIDTHDLVLEPSELAQHRFTLIVLHSCSGGPDDFLAFFHRLDPSLRGKVRAVVPCSPVRLETHEGWTKEQNSWFEYDAFVGDGNSLKYPEQLTEQRSRVLGLLEKERKRLPDGETRRIVLWGLSQGAGLAVDVALHASFQVGGVLALRGMALDEGSPRRPEGALPVDVLAINGSRDWLCPPAVAKTTYEALRGHGANIAFEEIGSLGHACARGRQTMNRHELERVNRWLCERWKGLS